MFWDFLIFLSFFEFLEILIFFEILMTFFGFLHTHILTQAHTHILTLTHSHTHTPTLTHIRLIRIERVIVSISYNMCRGSSCNWNSEVKRAGSGALWGWVIKWEVTVLVWIEDVSSVIWSKKSYMHSFSYYLGFYNFKIFWNIFGFSEILSPANCSVRQR
jgi:hypothetical protein